jgi:hypothetical protein
MRPTSSCFEATPARCSIPPYGATIVAPAATANASQVAVGTTVAMGAAPWSRSARSTPNPARVAGTLMPMRCASIDSIRSASARMASAGASRSWYQALPARSISSPKSARGSRRSAATTAGLVITPRQIPSAM